MNSIGYFTGPAHRARVTSPFGWRTHPIHGDRRHHNGVDMVLTPRGGVYTTPYDCTVIFIGTLGARGLVIAARIDGTNVVQIFQHMDKALCKVGDKLRTGDNVGVEGATGAVTGRHLHYELRIFDGSNIGSPVWGDPAEFFHGGGDVRKAYVVRAGDSLSKIAGIYGVTITQLAQWNNIENPNLIKVGQALFVEPDWQDKAKQLREILDKLVEQSEARERYIELQDQVVRDLNVQLHELLQKSEAQADTIDKLVTQMQDMSTEMEQYAGQAMDAQVQLYEALARKSEMEKELARYQQLIVLEFSWSHVIQLVKALVAQLFNRRISP